MSAMDEIRHLEGSLQTRASRDKGGDYSAVIAKNDMGVDLSRMDTSRFDSNPIILWQHNSNYPIGRATAPPVREDDGSWLMPFKIAAGDPGAERIQNLMDQDVLRAMSIGFSMARDDAGEYPVLHEVSVVSAGMDKDALMRGELELITRSFAGNVDDTERSDHAMSDTTNETIDREDQEAAVADDQTEIPDVDESAVDDQPEPERSVSGMITREEADEKIRSAIALERLIARTADMRVGGFNPEGATRRDILVNSLDGAVDNVDQRSDDYLEGALDMKIRRREDVADAIRSEASKAPVYNGQATSYRDGTDIFNRLGGNT